MNFKPEIKLRLMSLPVAVCTGLLVGMAGCLIAASGMVFASEVDVIFSDKHRPHVEAVSVLQQELKTEEVRLFAAVENGDTREELAALKLAVARRPDLIVLVGDDALRAAAAMNVRIPMVSLLAIRLHRGIQSGLPLTGVDLRPDPREIIRGLMGLLPPAARVFTYFSPELSGAYMHESEAAFEGGPLVLDAREWPERDVMSFLNQAMGSHDVYWMQLEERSAKPDILRLLFSMAAKRDKDIIGLSEKYVRAGALIAWSPLPDAIGYQGAVLGNRILQGKKPQNIVIQHPHKMKMSVNRNAGGGDVDQPSQRVVTGRNS